MTDKVDSDVAQEVDSKETLVIAMTEDVEDESDTESHFGEDMLIRKPKSSVVTEDVRLWRYLYRIPPSVEICVPSTHERVDWVVPG